MTCQACLYVASSRTGVTGTPIFRPSPLGETKQYATQASPQSVAFMRLARDTIDAKVCQQVKKFVERWGPLWLCRNPQHFDCHWTYEGGASRRESPCL